MCTERNVTLCGKPLLLLACTVTFTCFTPMSSVPHPVYIYLVPPYSCVLFHTCLTPIPHLFYIYPLCVSFIHRLIVLLPSYFRSGSNSNSEVERKLSRLRQRRTHPDQTEKRGHGCLCTPAAFSREPRCYS